ncbi:BofC C-terminal domain-containing protein [Bacillus sp. FJAT-49736]|uniref:BofC C-terminal domain-containing protein n=1 Tax=Bacillus sp. FJAT-49736 TaxID=2833582 RepID=UPI001BC9115A|nr:BofC C-terminal domain-containing protein [Bacillus sp. FJAT-49736]MBS4173677.1 BofC C-terminal domain-containing protein [Bacillus sp. FJAT-49736]
MTIVVRTILMAALFFGANLYTLPQSHKDPLNTNKMMMTKPSAQVLSKGQKTIILERVFMDGEVSEEILHEKRLSNKVYMNKYKSWQLVEMDDDQLVFQKKVDDISPLLKSNGYFGLSDDGTLSIFNGKPNKADIIQSFFQIDMKKLEGKKQEELLKGIPIKSKEDFTNVIETLKRYSISKQEQ